MTHMNRAYRLSSKNTASRDSITGIAPVRPISSEEFHPKKAQQRPHAWFVNWASSLIPRSVSNTQSRHVSKEPLKEPHFRRIVTPDQIVNSRAPSQNALVITPQSQGMTHQSTWQHFQNTWIEEEFTLSMSKLSLTGLCIGLMILGIIFFGLGFCVAVYTMGGSGTSASVASYSDAQMRAQKDHAWSDAQPYAAHAYPAQITTQPSQYLAPVLPEAPCDPAYAYPRGNAPHGYRAVAPQNTYSNTDSRYHTYYDARFDRPYYDRGQARY